MHPPKPSIKDERLSGSASASASGSSAGSSRGSGVAPGSNAHNNNAASLPHDADTELTRLIIQALGDMGYHDAKETLSRESGVRVESEHVSDFKHAILTGDYQRAEARLLELELADSASPVQSLFLIREQKFLEQLEARQSGQALETLRRELAPCKYSTDRLHFLSSLIMSSSAEDLRRRADWPGADGGSRANLLKRLSADISPNSMIPECKLQSLLDRARDEQVRDCLYHVSRTPVSLLASGHQCPRTAFPLHTHVQLMDQREEVWHVQFSPTGTFLATSSSDGTIIIYTTRDWEVLHVLNRRTTEQAQADRQANIWRGVTYVVFSPDESTLLACSQDPAIALWDIATGLRLNMISHTHRQPVSCAAFLPKSARSTGFVSGALDRQMNLYDMTGEVLHTWEPGRVYDLKVSEDGRFLAVVAENNRVQVYDLESREMVNQMQSSWQLTCLTISKDSRRILLSCSPLQDGPHHAHTTEVQEYSLPDLKMLRRYEGQKQGEFVIRSSYGGYDEQFVLSGSEDADVVIWHRLSETLIERVPGHTKSVGCVVWNPAVDAEWASGSDDGTVRIWTIGSGPDSARNVSPPPPTKDAPAASSTPLPPASSASATTSNGGSRSALNGSTVWNVHRARVNRPA
ncbi:hypothetical protein PYCC9005_001293 [Savitreella phatthalungensis]